MKISIRNFFAMNPDYLRNCLNMHSDSHLRTEKWSGHYTLFLSMLHLLHNNCYTTKHGMRNLNAENTGRKHYTAWGKLYCATASWHLVFSTKKNWSTKVTPWCMPMADMSWDEVTLNRGKSRYANDFFWLEKPNYLWSLLYSARVLYDNIHTHVSTGY